MAATLNKDAERHAQWLGMLQPEGLVVSATVLADAQAYVRRGPEVQAQIREIVGDDGRLADWRPFVEGVLGWPAAFLMEPTEAQIVDFEAELGAILRPTAVLKGREAPTLLLAWRPEGLLDDDPKEKRWFATHQERFERLLIETGVPIGLHLSPTHIRLTYAPAGEAAGRLTFPITALLEADGRILVDALLMLLGAQRLLASPKDRRLIDLLKDSRARQGEVTEKLAAQLEESLRILLRGFDVADARQGGALLQDIPPEALYEGLVTVLLRMVFILYAEDKSLLPMNEELYLKSYALTTLAKTLREDALLHAGSLDRRFGAWAHLMALTRLLFSGVRCEELTLPERRGDLFDPGRFPFLEGRRVESAQGGATLPPIDDAVVHQVLMRLRILEGQRLSYRNLEVEQIGSVYEALMGFSVARSYSEALPLKPAGVVVELEALRASPRPLAALADALGERGPKVAKRFPALKAFKVSDDEAGDLARLRDILAPHMPRGMEPIPPGSHYLQPGEARRKSGSHYTPRSLTEPIVARTLEPVLMEKGPPSSAAILDLKVCDPAMGSGAFLAEACRYLARALVEAWGREGRAPEAAHREGREIYARRLVAERCLFGVDKNAFAVHLARLSLWLVTSARDLPFTFLDHNLKEGDALIGATPKQLAAFALSGKGPGGISEDAVKAAMKASAATRLELTALQKTLTLRLGYSSKTQRLSIADHEVWDERQVGDLLVAAYWAGGKKKEQKERLERMAAVAQGWYPGERRDRLGAEALTLLAQLPFKPFHWHLEFPEVFSRPRPGFDCVVGNPPFGGETTIRSSNGEYYIKMLGQVWPHASGKADLCAYFFLKSAGLLRNRGTFGLVGTNSISQGVSRETGLKYLVLNNVAEIYWVDVDMVWPGAAAVVVSCVNAVKRRRWTAEKYHNGQSAFDINSSLEPLPEGTDPVSLKSNQELAYTGSKIYGQGFVVETSDVHRLLDEDVSNQEVVFPYIGGQEVNSSPALAYDRYVVNFGDRSLSECEAWPSVLRILEARVKPERMSAGNSSVRNAPWWLHFRSRTALYRRIAALPRAIVNSIHSKYLLFAFQPTNRVFSHALNVFALDDNYSFALLQSRTHEHWARDMGSSMKTDLRYTPSYCFETFPFPRPSEDQRARVSDTGRALYDHRMAVMAQHQIGMTETWNRLHDADNDDPEIVTLRALRDAMDRAVLDAYGWTDVEPDDRLEILKRLRALNATRAKEERG